MKKLMIALGAITMAVVANAGAVTWGALYVVDPVSGTDFSGGAAYLFADSIDAGDVAKAITEGTFFTDYAGDASYQTVFSEGGFTETKCITGLTGDYTFYMVALDSDSKPGYYFITDPITKTLPSTAGAKSYTWELTGAKSDWTAVPEPTSGLLLLLGVAGLALRRRRA